VQSGETVIVAAGGDGTVHQVANCLMRLDDDERCRVRLGAIALGSSNDFHKPQNRAPVAGIRARLECDHALLHNVVRCAWDVNGALQQEYFVVNASMGIVADANRLYNSNRGVAGVLKRVSVGAAIAYCSIATLLASRNRRAKVTIDGISREGQITNLSVLLNPHFGGGLRYDTVIDPGGPSICVQLCEGMSLARKIWTFLSLSFGRFSGLPKTSTLWCRSVRIDTRESFAFEMDGEVRQTNSVEMTLVRGALSICT
jgi:diacylglycerol kinase family enzyme